MPSVLYKYRAWNKYSKDILVNHRLFFSAPENFNDLCDCVPYQPTDIHLGFQFAALRKIDGQLVVQQGHRDISISDVIARFCQSLRVCCFSKTYQSILMWSHYADCHKGICLVFDQDKDPSFFKTTSDIHYSNTHHGINYPEVNAVNAINVKYTDWKYEEEVRVISSEHEFQEKGIQNNLVAFDPASLSEIIFGAKASVRTINQVKSMCRLNGLGHVVFSQMYLCDSSEFKIECKRI